MEKATARELNTGDLRVDCPECKRRHLFTPTEFGKYILNNEPDDIFDRVTGDPGVPDILYPIFVCRKHSCHFEGTVSIKAT